MYKSIESYHKFINHKEYFTDTVVDEPFDDKSKQCGWTFEHLLFRYTYLSYCVALASWASYRRTSI